MPKVRYSCFALTSLFLSFAAIAKVDLSSTVNCTYQSGQVLDKKKAENVKNPRPLNWTFNGLLSKKPIFVSGGDTDEIITVSMKNGIIIYLPHSIGTSTFTIWITGESFWSKQSNVLGYIYSQHYLGNCEN